VNISLFARLRHTYWAVILIGSSGVLPRGIFSYEEDEETGTWTQQHTEELDDLHFSSNSVTVILMSRNEGKSRLGTPSYTWEVNRLFGK
jgi:hypothetical protein